MKRLFLLLALGACSGLGDSGPALVDAGTSGDAGTNPCSNLISWLPDPAEASDIVPVRATVNVLEAGVFTYTWTVEHDNATVPHTVESSDGREIGFIAADPGVYHTSVVISGGVTSCPYAEAYINVGDPNANANVYRLRTVPPAIRKVPPQEQVIQVNGGGDIYRAIVLDPGVAADGVVRNGPGGAGVPAYVKFMPLSLPTAFTELFTTSTGTYSTNLIGVTHNVLVIPTSPLLAPKLVQWTPTTQSLVVGAGTLVSGTVRNPAGTGLAGAKVQLVSNGVPSTLATTAGDGTFSLRADFAANASITVKVTPPLSSGLPRLEAAGVLSLAAAMQINYAASLTTCSLANVPVRRSATNQPGAKVTVVGSLAGVAGTITAGATINALGSVRVATTADGAGRLPAVSVPRSSLLSAVVELGMNDLAVDALDTSACSVASIDAPALIVASGTVLQDVNVPLGGIRVEATPQGVLALADAQTVATTTTANGAFSLSLAPGGRYDVRFIDPYARVARREDNNITAAGVPGSVTMPVALKISGKVSVVSSSQPLPGTSIQLLCAQCTGVDASRPIAETATNSLSEYAIAVPDPGTM